MARIPYVLVAAALAAALPAQNPWVKITPTASPGARRAGAMGFDGTANRMIIYGGLTQTPSQILGETWSYNGTTWQLLTTAGGQPRWGHQIVRIPTLNRLLTFGGRSPAITTLANDTSQWTGSAWTPVVTVHAPTPRFRYGLAYDTLRNRAVLFGGRSSLGSIGDTWEFDGTDWTHITTEHSPAPREDMLVRFDAALNRTILFGGYDADLDILYGDTWQFDGVDWKQVLPASGAPTLFRTTSVYDTKRKRIVMSGGFDGTNYSQATYEFSGSSWDLVGGATGTPFTTESYGAFNGQNNKFIVFGGVGVSFGNETWEFTGKNTAIAGMFGEGCATSVGVAEGSATIPATTGLTYTIHWTGLPLTTAAVIVFQGLSNQNYQGIPLPVDASILGLSGCTVLVSPDFVSLALAGSGTTDTTMFLPNDPTLVNLPFYSQILIPDDTAVNGVGGTSRGIRAIIGAP
ncbi:MAG: hypothetical protein JNK78_13890 [Planctomycetes bacterium]|nr:hypothetical protein [Planctomycetota bacterium]